MNTGNKHRRHVGQKLYQIISPNMTAAEIKKSIKLTARELTGMTKRGKYILEIRLVFAIKLLLAPINELEKNCQGSIAAKTRSGYGTPLDGILANLPKTMVKTTMVSNGRNTAHRTPIAVCL
jgi:hypothetical protein